MQNKTKGAWLINHTRKLQDFKDTQDFEDIELAGKCGIFLSNLAASEEQSDLNRTKVEAIQKISEIKKTEIETIKGKLAEAKLIELGKNGSLSVLGITTSSVLEHTAEIFKASSPGGYQEAALDLAENISDLPKPEKLLKEYISDNHKLSQFETTDLFNQSEQFGFIDSEKLDDESRFFFNGNLFRKESVQKTSAVLGSLKPEDTRKIIELDNQLNESGCLSVETASGVLGTELLSKLQSIGMYDFNEVSNSVETKVFVTKPSAFSKYGNPFEEDALDLAKAFVSALYYGMNYSSVGRGKITMLQVLMRKLIDGHEVGPADAIGEDYQLLEYKRVIQIRHEGGYRYYMRLLKRDVGELALQVLQFGDAIEQSIKSSVVYSGKMTNYVGPEQNRTKHRRTQGKQSKKAVAETLNALRTYR